MPSLNDDGDPLLPLRQKLASAEPYHSIKYKTSDLVLPANRTPMPPAPRCGLYFLFDGDDLVYIGQSTNIPARLYAHMGNAPFAFDSFASLECERGRLNELEALYTLKFRPRHNVTSCGRPTHTGVLGWLKKVKLDGRWATTRVPPLHSATTGSEPSPA